MLSSRGVDDTPVFFLWLYSALDNVYVLQDSALLVLGGAQWAFIF